MSLKKLSDGSVHRICSGQVVLSLAVAVKELVENSIDADANKISRPPVMHPWDHNGFLESQFPLKVDNQSVSIIRVRVKEHGSELLEVLDNGCGISPDNYQTLTLKHYTSKISEFTDIATVDTFGFRGEALSSLCALSNLVVTTRQISETVGTRIEYDHNGQIKHQMKCAREVGTTVTLTNLFQTLPVRHKEFLRNIKKEYNKMVHMLQGYCIIASGVRLSCYHQTGKSKRALILSTIGSCNTIDNITSIFGAKQTQQVVQIVQSSCEKVEDFSSEIIEQFRLIGYISPCSHGSGRSTTDRQFYFFNGRPCDHAKLSKTVNEVYHHYNKHQYPFVVLNIETSTRESVDVNLTPDKRQILVQQEKAMLSLVKESLVEMFEPMQTDTESKKITASFAVNKKLSSNSPIASLSSFKRSASSTSDSATLEPRPKQPKLTDFGISKTLSVASNDNKDTFNACITTLSTSASVTKAQDSSIDGSPLCSGIHDGVQPTITSPQTDTSIDSGVELGASQDKVAYDTDRTSTPLICETIERAGTVLCNMKVITSRLTYLYKTKTQPRSCKKKHYFHAKIRPDSNKDAEEELKKELSKSSFKSMKVIGQFNLGFIIAKLGNDLFIVDQHATDEKYNFERLKRDTVIEHQTLIQPLPLSMPTTSESIIIDNMDIFLKNGFKFIINEEAPPTQRVLLIGKPVSKNWSMEKPEIEELVFLLSDYPGELVRPACVTKMFASRACRSSIMIGMSLTKQHMSKVLARMSEMDQPWNCPHGRPTLRHLLDMDKLS